MTEEEIRPIAEQYVEEYCHCSDGEYTDGSLICAGIGTALIVARRLEKKNAELREQIEKMKCCTTCKYYNMKYLPYWCDKLNEPKNCWRKCDDWKLKEIEK